MNRISLWVLLTSFLSCIQPPQPKEVFCDAEQIEQQNTVTYFTAVGARLLNGDTQSDDRARSGHHSSKLAKPKTFGMGYVFKNINPGDRFEVKVWKYGGAGVGVLAAKSVGAFYYDTKYGTLEKDGWEELQLNFEVAQLNDAGEVDIHTWLQYKDSIVYFDDLNIRHIPAGQQPVHVYKCIPTAQPVEKYLFLGHIYRWFSDGERVDSRIELLDKTCYDQIWLGGDVCSEATKNPTTIQYIDSIFSLSDPGTHWTVGNHDIRKGYLDRIEKRTGRKSYYAHHHNGLTILVLNTCLDQIYQNDSLKLCKESQSQFELIKRVCDTIAVSSHLLVLQHHALWYEIDPVFWKYANNPKMGWRVVCDTNATFGNALYPLLKEVQTKGIQVMCLAGDAGIRDWSINEKDGFFRSKDGIIFLASGINNSAYVGKVLKRSMRRDRVLELIYNPTNSKLTWSFQNLDSLLESQKVTKPAVN